MSRHPCIWMGLGLSAIFGQAQAAWDVNMRSGATDVSQSVFDLHMTIFWICVVISVIVFGAMFWSMIMHRRSTGQKPAHFHESTTVEILWTVVPLAILVVMAIPATKTLIEIYDTSESELDIQVTGYQWKWHYKYLGEDVEFFSNLTTPRDQINNQSPKGEHYLLEVDEPLVIPAGAKVRFLITAADVIHSWWVPDLAVKKDAIPGFINESWTRVEQPGIYRGQCTELCGKDHGFMPVVVEVKSRRSTRPRAPPATSQPAKASRRCSRPSRARPSPPATSRRTSISSSTASRAPPWRRSASSCRKSIWLPSSPTSATPGATRQATWSRRKTCSSSNRPKKPPSKRIR